MHEDLAGIVLSRIKHGTQDTMETIIEKIIEQRIEERMAGVT